MLFFVLTLTTAALVAIIAINVVISKLTGNSGIEGVGSGVVVGVAVGVVVGEAVGTAVGLGVGAVVGIAVGIGVDAEKTMRFIFDEFVVVPSESVILQ